ncbi:shieldin complex subunit 1 isoform X4 [Erinaceus europaeus]|uniref:Shieldin complex subunit 1 isoform X4 n=1 Tax=Erinaceus europaeus TaxID=9365 RepID=A0ABM3X1U2_ERIEU|nr:shieldin complex subunit 1 isoform X4 [Erinaceus europaeus]
MSLPLPAPGSRVSRKLQLPLMRVIGSWTMEPQEATPDSQSEDSNALDLPSASDIRDYVVQKSRQEANSGTFSSVEALSFPHSSDVDPADICKMIHVLSWVEKHVTWES